MKYLKFWGTRGSCPVSGSLYQKYGGNTSCLEIRYDNICIIIDAGTGIRPFGESVLTDSFDEFHLFIGHNHWDHLIGFPFFSLLYQKRNSLHIWSPPNSFGGCKELLKQLLAIDFFPVHIDQMAAQITFHTIQTEDPIIIRNLSIEPFKTFHTDLAYGFKIKTPHQTIGYITDNEIFYGHQGSLHEISSSLLKSNQKFINTIKDVDLLIHEAQYFPEEYKAKVGWGHSSVFNSVALIKHAEIKKWLVTHHDPKHTDEELDLLQQIARQALQEEKISCHATWIGDGHTVILK